MEQKRSGYVNSLLRYVCIAYTQLILDICPYQIFVCKFLLYHGCLWDHSVGQRFLKIEITYTLSNNKIRINERTIWYYWQIVLRPNPRGTPLTWSSVNRLTVALSMAIQVSEARISATRATAQQSLYLRMYNICTLSNTKISTYLTNKNY